MNISELGLLIGKSKSGIEVYQKFTDRGSVITQSLQNGKLFKRITQDFVEFDSIYSNTGIKTFGNVTVVENFKTGIKTMIEKFMSYAKKDMSNPRKLPLKQEFMVFHTKTENGKEVLVGDCLNRVSDFNGVSYEFFKKYNAEGTMVSHNTKIK